MASAINNAAGSELTGVASGDAERARQFAETAQPFTGVIDLSKSRGLTLEVDAVYIKLDQMRCTRLRSVPAAADAGKHVLCESR